MRLSHRFKVASKKKWGTAACHRRSRWIKKTDRRKKANASSPAMAFLRGLHHGWRSAVENIEFDLASLLPEKLVLNVSEQEFLSFQSLLKEPIEMLARRPDVPEPPAAPLPPKHERYISKGCVRDVLNISEPAKKTVTQKLAGFITSLAARVRGVFNA